MVPLRRSFGSLMRCLPLHTSRRYDGTMDMIIHDLDDAAIRLPPHGRHRSYAGASKR
jgi:hypothetical protein